jgi:hypothetical protein
MHCKSEEELSLALQRGKEGHPRTRGSRMVIFERLAVQSAAVLSLILENAVNLSVESHWKQECDENRPVRCPSIAATGRRCRQPNPCHKVNDTKRLQK